MRKIITAFMMLLCAVCMASAANYLTFTAEEDSSTFGIMNEKNNPDVQYSLDGGETWTALAAGDTITLAHKGDKALLKGNNSEGFSKDWAQYSSFTMTGKVDASGSVMSLIDGVGLSTEIPNNYCFQKLFSGCTSLTQAPELPATTLAYSCYSSMFSGCTSLTKAPELPATTLTGNCYGSMFSGCTSLTQAPEFPASSLEDGCYYKMFEGCTSLTQASVLPATTLAYSCYSRMFSGCTSLTQAPELPATTLAKNCYTHMFTGCTNLSEIRVAFVTWEDFDVWVENVSYTGTFICPEELPLECGKNRIPLGWEVKNIIDGDTVNVPINRDYLTFTAEEDGSSFEMKNFNKNDPEVHYSLDGGETWTRLLQGDTILLAHKGDKALLRGGNPQGFSKGEYDFSTFKMTGKVAASGNVMSLIDGSGSSTEIPCSYCFRKLFSGCTSLTQAPELPATTLASYCYWGMFLGCTSLTQSPALPATTLAEKCYYEMFSGCTGLTQAQDLSATTMAGYSCQRMFYNCTSLTQAPALQATKLGKYSCQNMFSNCTSLTQAPALPATTLSTYCYDGMFSGCTSLTQAPALPATSLESSCYYKMFEGCTSLTQAPALPATRMCVYCYQSMFSGCTSLTQAPALPATSLESSCYYKMFEGCTSLTQAPVLPATRIVYDSYENMFRGCTNLSEIKVSFTDWIDGSTYEWVRNVAPAGTFICSKALPLTYGVSRIPEGWTVIYVEDINYLTFTAEEDSSSFGIVNMNNNPDVQYSLDGGATWIALAEGDTVVLAHVGDKALLRGVNPQGFSKKDSYSSFRMSGKMAASGSVMSLIDGLGLSTEIPGEFCFRNLFSDCTSLTQAPELPATALAEDCYYGMFFGCTSLTQAPELPVTALAEGCYAYMFSGCTSLTRAPELPAMTLAEACYFGMFEGCTSLTRAPALLATTLPTVSNVKSGCYGLMFSGCTSLSRIRVSFDDWNEGLHTEVWVKDVAPTGTFICPKALALEYGMDRIPDGWTVKYIEDEPNYLTFTAEEDSSSFGIVNIVESYPEVTCSPDIWYSTDGGDSWNELKQGDTIPLKKGKKALLKGVNPKGVSIGRSEDILDGITYVSFVMSGKIAASGNVMSLVDGEGKTTQIPANYCFYGLFSGCKSLTQAPVLPATMLTEYCYGEMFAGCTGLTEAPELPATDMKRGCYASMFSGCNLTQAPKLPALNLAPSCYGYMFSWNKMLTQAPELPATELADSCYDGMFLRCEKLVQAPILLATKLKPHCYSSMFEGCISLTQAPELIATELAPFCYCRMFHSCTGLTEAPELPDTKELVSDSYRFMFSYCSNLNTIKVHFKAWVEDNYSGYCWVNDVSPTGTFYCPRELPIEYGIARIPKGWNVVYIDDTVAVEVNYLTFTAEEDGSSFGIVNNGDNNPDLQYSLDGGKTWTALAVGDTVILAHKGDKALLKGNNSEGFSKSWEQYSTFKMTGKVAASGSVMSLIDGMGLSTEIPNGYCFCRLFRNCTSLTQAPELPATTLAISCYEYMFYGCTSLTKAPELPATTLVVTCYLSMFSDCVSLTSADLSFEQYVGERSCCNDMFRGCTNLSEIKVSFEEWGDGDLVNPSWVKNVAPTGTFICPKTLPLEYGVNRIPEGWTVKYIDDTVAVEANYLTFTAEEDGSSFGIVNNGGNNPDVQYSLDGGETWNILAEGDTVILAHKGDKALLRGNNPEGFSKSWEQYSTFKMTGKVAASGSVMSLIDGVGVSTEISKSFCFYRLFSGCTSLTQAPELPAKTLAYYCYNSMFEGCTSLTQAPELPATEMTFYCYNRMFSGCTSLTQAPELPATTLFENCYSGMFSGCTSLTRAPELPAIKMFSYCYSDMFSGCTSLTQAPELPAKEFWGKYSYSGMFSGCTSLSEINVSFDDWDKLDATFEWVADVAPTGTFICPKTLALEYGISRIPEGWTVKYIEDMANYLTFTAEEDGSSFGIVNNGSDNPDVQYSLDGGATWIALAEGDTVILAHKGDKALLKGNNPEGFSKSWEQYSTFKMTGKVAASGSVMSLIDGVGLSTKIPSDFCFYELFYNCTSLTQAPELPATTLTDWCYQGMFGGCTSLTQAPELPATTLPTGSDMEGGCYRVMFYGCTSLTQAPELPATTLSDNCYFRMFYGCTKLSEIHVSFDDWDYYWATVEWVKDVAPTGTFICPKALALEYGVDRIPEGWTVKYIEDGSGVNSTLADGITVWTDDLTIFVRGAEGEVSLYDMSGRIVAASNSTDEERALSVPAKGVYVVRTSGGERSVLVR